MNGILRLLKTPVANLSEIESLTLQTTRYLPVIKEVHNKFGLFLLLPPYFLAITIQKQTADCGPYRRGERKIAWKDLASRYPSRRVMALARSRYPSPGATWPPIKGAELVFNLTMTNAAIWRSR